MKIREIHAKSILTRTRIPGIDYCINPYTGCAHACRYCYATFMKKFTGHDQAWGTFVDVKVNTVDLLKRALRRRHTGVVVFSSVTDPYQPLERRYGLTRGCLELLARSSLSVSILTKSDLVTRDIDLLRHMGTCRVGLTIGTEDDRIKHIFELSSPSVGARIEALRRLHQNGITTYAFIGPILPMNPEKLVDLVAPYVHEILIDRMNYAWKVRDLYKAHHLEFALEPAYFEDVESRLLRRSKACGVHTTIV